MKVNMMLPIKHGTNGSADPALNQNQDLMNPHADLPEVSSDTGTSDSDDLESRKARKRASRMHQMQHSRPQVAEMTTSENPFAYAMRHGRFPRPVQAPQQQRPEAHLLTDPGYLWNAVPPRYSQYLDMEAAHGGSSTSGSTGSSEGSLSDPEFIVKDENGDNHTEEELKELQRLFPKTFKRA
jgi:hypothetical protein